MLPSRIALDPGPLPSTGITRLPRYYGPLRHPAGPDWPSRVSGGRVHATDRASRVAAFFIFHACWRHYPGRYRSVHRSLASQSANGLPLNNGGSASALSVSRPAQRSLRVPARMVAEPPYAALCHQSASVYIVASVNRPGCYQPERQLLRGVRTRQKKAPFHGARCHFLCPIQRPIQQCRHVRECPGETKLSRRSNPPHVSKAGRRPRMGRQTERLSWLLS